MKKKIMAVITALIISLSSVPAYAHSGRTDSAGGHHDYNNVSGLGSYHYHHGYPAHLHTNGVCPYSSNTYSQTYTGGSSTSSSSSKPAVSATAPVKATAPASALNSITVSKNTITVYVNGQKITADNFVYDGTTYVPIRAIGDSIGATIDFDAIAKTATITIPNKVQTVTQPNAQDKAYITILSYANKALVDAADLFSYFSTAYGGISASTSDRDFQTYMTQASLKSNEVKSTADTIYNLEITPLYELADKMYSMVENCNTCITQLYALRAGQNVDTWTPMMAFDTDYFDIEYICDTWADVALANS